MTPFPEVPLANVASVFNGKTPSQADQRHHGHPVLKVRDVDATGGFRGPFESFVEDAFARRHSDKFAADGDTLILNAAHNASYVGSKTFFVSGEPVGALVTGEWLVVRPNLSKLEAAYAYHWLDTDTGRRRVRDLVKGIHLYPKDVARLNIPVPAIAEQKRLAAILDQANELRRKRRVTLDLLDSLPKTIFCEMFGDPLANSRSWPLRLLGDVGELERGVSKHRPRNAPELLGGPYPLVQTGDVANCDGYIDTYNSTYSEIGLRQSRLWKRGTLCITIAANIGRTGILNFDACFPDSIVGFSPGSSIKTEYVQSWMSFIQKQLEDDAPSFAQKNINLAILRELQIPVPSLELQDVFVSRLGGLRALKNAACNHFTKLGALFASLRHRAFRGELTVKDAEHELEMAN